VPPSVLGEMNAVGWTCRRSTHTHLEDHVVDDIGHFTGEFRRVFEMDITGFKSCLFVYFVSSSTEHLGCSTRYLVDQFVKTVLFL
jgi:hypothetical protein